MKKTLLTFGTVMALALTAALPGVEKPQKDAASHLGTWQLVSTRYGDAKKFSDVSNQAPHIKMLTADHFIWVIYDSETKLISRSMGGSYRLQGGSYTETVEFFLPAGMKIYLGKEQVFAIRVEGDKLFQSGKLSDGMKIEEIWQRVN
ncbi:MAG TPA: hypothetical protein VG167_03735 [Verrucomicrobiae bacterium]|nr:hypothetical protein [Verrucomicrobiae bacterium]